MLRLLRLGFCRVVFDIFFVRSFFVSKRSCLFWWVASLFLVYFLLHLLRSRVIGQYLSKVQHILRFLCFLFFLLVLDGSVFLYRFLCCLFPSSCCVVPVGRVTMITMSTPLSTKYNKEMIGRVSMLFFQLHSEPMSASASSPVVVCLALCLFECFELFDFVWICLSQFCFISRYLRLLGGCPS